jgi:segregation and condensation protein A
VPFPWSVRLDQYEGPLDLLLDLIRRQKIDIQDIPIATITEQYFAYMEEAAALSIELSAEFVYMAATLIHIKSRSLLPRDPELAKIEEEGDPRKELVERLLEHERFKNAAEMLKQKRLVEENVWSNPQMKKFLADEDDPGLAVNLMDLMGAMQEIIDRAKKRPTYELESESVSVGQMIPYLCEVLKKLKSSEPLPVGDLFEVQPNRRSMICLLLAILEMAKAQALVLRHRKDGGGLGVHRGAQFEEYMATSASMQDLEKDYQ